MSAGPIDAARAEAFATQMLGIVNGGFLSLMASLGHQTGLFDTMDGLPPATSQEIADAAGLKERYVREWLGAMVVGRIVEYEPSSRTYRLPPAHAACLTRAAGTENLAGLARFVSMLGVVEPELVDVFRSGGGLPYAAYPRFHEVLAEEGRTVLEANLLAHTLPLVHGLVDRLEAGIDVADVGCGRGVAVALMARRFPHSRFAGLDFSAEAIAWAQDAAAREALPNARYEVRDAVDVGEPPEQYDFVTAFDAIHDQARPRQVLSAVRRALRPGATFLMSDVAVSSHLERNLKHPLAPFLYTLSTMHCMTVSLSQGGEGLGTCWGEESARAMLAEAGFSRVDVALIEGDPLNAFYVCRA